MSFADVIADEERQVQAGTPGCGYIDPGDHGGLTCVRLLHTRFPDPKVEPHVGRDRDRQLAQWTEPCVVPDPVADDAARVASRKRATHALLANIDLGVFAAALGVPPPPAQPAPDPTPDPGPSVDPKSVSVGGAV